MFQQISSAKKSVKNMIESRLQICGFDRTCEIAKDRTRRRRWRLNNGEKLLLEELCSRLQLVCATRRFVVVGKTWGKGSALQLDGKQVDLVEQENNWRAAEPRMLASRLPQRNCFEHAIGWRCFRRPLIVNAHVDAINDGRDFILKEVSPFPLVRIDASKFE